MNTIMAKHWEAWHLIGSGRLVDEGNYLEDMRQKIDESNERAVSRGYKKESFRIIEVYREIEYGEEGEFISSLEKRKAVEVYPKKPADIWVYDDGGRSKYFKAEKVGDCVARAIAIATGLDYKEVYDKLNKMSKQERTSMRKQGVSNARNGVYKETFKKLLTELGWVWHPTMQIGQGCKVHLKADELPQGTLIVSLSKHLTCVKDGVIHDTYDCSRGGTRCVYGYFTKEDRE